jgi:choice-of-anchor B domain-containing protein
MLKKSLLITGSILFFLTANAQLNINLVGHLPFPNHVRTSDVWGHVDASGNEYALVGLFEGTAIVDISNPSAPLEIFFSVGANTRWRDLKVWNNHVYITNDNGGGGLKIIDMSNLPGPITAADVYSFSGINYQFSIAHDIYIDENGFAYVMGANNGVGGAIILDLNNDPKIPQEVGRYNDFYIHDGMVRGDTLWAGCIYDGFMAVIDVSDKANPITLATQNTPSSKTHNVWPSDDGQIVFTTDEKSDAFIGAYDVSDLTNISELDRIQSSPGEFVIPHNVFVLGDFLITSYYRDGITIHNASNPSNIVEVGNYDTSSGFSGDGFNGCWGVYPYLPSGLILATDIEEGLFILDPTYISASYLDGNVIDSITGFAIDGVRIEVDSTAVSANTNIIGDYQVGLAISGTYAITYSKLGYISKTITGVVLTSGNTATVNVELKRTTLFVCKVKIVDANTLNPIPNVKINFVSSNTDFTDSTDNLGNWTWTGIPSFPEGNWDLYIAKWGYKKLCLTQELLTEAGNVHVFEMEPGYEDDFKFDLDWTVSSLIIGQWEKDVPIEALYNGVPATPAFDSQQDCSEEAYVTRNGNITGGVLDVSSYGTVLTSPVFDLSSYTNPYLNYEKWFFNDGIDTSGDSLTIKLENGVDTVLVDFSVDGELDEASWSMQNVQISNYLTPTSSMHLIVRGIDSSPNDIVEAGFDNFSITEGNIISVSEVIDNEGFIVHPNPFNSEINISFNNKEMQDVTVEVLDLAGRIIDQKEFNNTSVVRFKNDYKRGVYFMNVYGNGKLIKTEKVIKL